MGTKPLLSPSQDKRLRISDHVRRLNSIVPDDELFRSAVHAGGDEAILRQWIGQKFRKNSGALFDVGRTAENVDRLFSMGGIVSGGAALAFATGAFETKDIDFYFNDEISYVMAHLAVIDDPAIDVNFYIDEPHELHDMSVVMCNLGPDGVMMTPQCLLALDSGVSDIYLTSVIYPIRTVARMFKYHERLGIRFRIAEIVAFCSMYGLSSDVFQKVMELGV
jgi:hypothetical protein